MGVGGVFLERSGIDNGEVGGISLFELAAFFEAELFGGQRGHFADGFGQRNRLPIERGAEELGMAAVGARVRMVVAERTPRCAQRCALSRNLET